MPSNTREYAHAYYLIHKKHLKKIRRVYYAANRARIIAKQIEWNRAHRTSKRPPRKDTGVIRSTVYRMRGVHADRPRNLAEERGPGEPETGEHGDPVPGLP